MDCGIIMNSISLRKRFGRAVMIEATQERVIGFFGVHVAYAGSSRWRDERGIEIFRKASPSARQSEERQDGNAESCREARASLQPLFFRLPHSYFATTLSLLDTFSVQYFQFFVKATLASIFITKRPISVPRSLN